MKRCILMLAAAALLPIAALGDDESKKEIERFEGTWKLVSLDDGDKKLSEEAFKDVRLILKGNEFTHKGGGIVYKGTFKVDAAKTPKTIDITFTDGPEKGKTLAGIYELDGDTYKLCIDPAGKKRPTEFAANKKSGHVLEVMKREKK